MRKQPVRTCVACRASKPKKDLVRIVRTPEGEVKVDPTGKANGRGAYICPAVECFELAVKKGKLAAALESELDDKTVESLRADFEALAPAKRAR